jgi:hypothetical protein
MLIIKIQGFVINLKENKITTKSRCKSVWIKFKNWEFRKSPLKVHLKLQKIYLKVPKFVYNEMGLKS